MTDQETVTITLATAFVPPRTISEPDTGYYSDEAETCAGCDEEFPEDGAGIWHNRRPYHPACYVRMVETSTVRDAWLTIASDIGRNPRKHSAATVRATLENLATLARGGAA